MKISSQINGVPRQDNWKPISMEIVHEDQGRQLKESESPWLGPHALIFRPRAIAVLGSLLRDNGELLPLRCGEAEVKLFNATRVLDALDEAASSIVRFGTGRVMWIKRYVFRPEAIRDVDIF